MFTKIRTLFIPQWYPYLLDTNSATGTFVREHVQALKQYEEVAVLYFRMTKRRWPTMKMEYFDDTDVPTWFATVGKSFIPYTSPLVYSHYIKQTIRNVIAQWGIPDIIHTQDFFADKIIHICGEMDIPLVISQHWTGFLRREVEPSTLKTWNRIFQNASRILAANCQATQDYEFYGFSGSVGWLPNTLNTAIFNTINAPTNRQPWLLHASGFTPQKRVADILEAFALVYPQRPNAVLHFAGDGVARTDFEMLAEKLLPKHAYKFHGFMAKPQLADLMRQCRGFVFPSDNETFGCVLMEAMACGCIVLTTNVGGIPCVVRDAYDEGIKVNVGDVEAIANGMLDLIDQNTGIDSEKVSHGIQNRFSHAVVGRLLHSEHIAVAKDHKISL